LWPEWPFKVTWSCKMLLNIEEKGWKFGPSEICYYVYNVFIWHLIFCDLHNLSTWCQGHGYQNKIHVWNLTKTCVSTFPRGNFSGGILAKRRGCLRSMVLCVYVICFHMALINSMASWALRPLGLLVLSSPSCFKIGWSLTCTRIKAKQ
jgi:hypothetical protein